MNYVVNQCIHVSCEFRCKIYLKWGFFCMLTGCLGLSFVFYNRPKDNDSIDYGYITDG